MVSGTVAGWRKRVTDSEQGSEHQTDPSLVQESACKGYGSGEADQQRSTDRGQLGSAWHGGTPPAGWFPRM